MVRYVWACRGGGGMVGGKVVVEMLWDEEW